VSDALFEVSFRDAPDVTSRSQMSALLLSSSGSQTETVKAAVFPSGRAPRPDAREGQTSSMVSGFFSGAAGAARAPASRKTRRSSVSFVPLRDRRA